MTLRSASYSLKYTENTPITAVRKVCLSVRRQCLSRPIQRGKPVEKSNIDQFCFGVRNAYSAHNQFPAITQAERMVDRTGKPVGEGTGTAGERESSNAQIRTLFDEQRQMIIAEYCEKIGHHELQAARAEEERRIPREELWRQQMDFHEVHQQSYRDGGITKIPKFYLRYARKTKAHRGP